MYPFDPNISVINIRKSIINKPNRKQKITINQFDASFMSNEEIDLQNNLANVNILDDE